MDLKWFHLLVIVALALIAGPATSTSLWADCDGSASVTTAQARTDRSIDPGETGCFHFNAAENSPVIHVFSPAALICLDPDVTTEGADTAKIMIRRCTPGVVVYDANRCTEILDAALDGTVGSSGTQNACDRVPPGAYVIVNDTSAGTDEAIVSFEAE